MEKKSPAVITLPMRRPEENGTNLMIIWLVQLYKDIFDTGIIKIDYVKATILKLTLFYSSPL